jgi:copper homeostasis protein CutC
MAAIAFNLKKYLKKGGRKPSIGIFEAIMDVFQGHLTTFYRHIRPRPVLQMAP